MEPELSSQRDGVIWWERIKARQDGIKLWMFKLIVAERAGVPVYLELAKNPLVPDWAKVFCLEISNQEKSHWDLTKAIAIRDFDYVEDLTDTRFEETLSELDMNERRSLMRLSTIISHPDSTVQERSMAATLIVDEAYHCWFTNKLLIEIGDIKIVYKD